LRTRPRHSAVGPIRYKLFAQATLSFGFAQGDNAAKRLFASIPHAKAKRKLIYPKVKDLHLF
jgi:hypothetical protein